MHHYDTHREPTQQTRHIHPMFDQCWANVVDGGPALVKHCVDVSCLLGRVVYRHMAPSGLSCLILVFTQLKLFLATATHILQAGDNYCYLFNMRPNICKS